MRRSGSQCPPAAASSLQLGRDVKRIRVYDLRFNEKEPKEKTVKTSSDFNNFCQALHKEFEIRSYEVFVLTTTDRTLLDSDKFKELPDGSTLYLLKQETQALPRAIEEQISFTPHYNTITQCGMYEYYASEGQTSLPYALAELIDNSLSATAKTSGVRTIEIRMMFDETFGKPAVIVLDNGCGMTSVQLKNWAVYRLSKFTRDNGTFASQGEGYVRPDPVPRSLNSDISYFGVGGKQAIFYIGDSARMISKPKGSPDVHELILSKEEFEKKERSKEDIYRGFIKNRKPCDSAHVTKKEETFLHSLIAEEKGKESFTAVVITGVLPEHIATLKNGFDAWTRQLAHVYHYYIHGVNGNVSSSSSSTTSDESPKIDIQITLSERPLKQRVINLRDIEDDMQSLYIKAAADTFEFKASTGLDTGTVEGIIRYHPFLYDKETYPEDPYSAQASPDDDDLDNESVLVNQTKGKRPIFECFWNGRLIPYTTVSELRWCARPSKGATLPVECYNRFSGVLFTDDRFQVTTNKLTFIDLEQKLANNDTIFTTVVSGQKSSKRSKIEKDFLQWLQNCHAQLDKQVKFLGYKGKITRTDVPTKKMQQPWATFSSIEWDGKTYKTGQLVKSQKTQRILYGTVVRFLLFGNYDVDVFATGGLVELSLEPRALHDATKIIPISKIDKTATDESIKKVIDNDLAKLPEELQVEWPEGNPWLTKAAYAAGTPLGPVSVKILNKNGESLSKMPSTGQGQGLKLSVKLSIVRHDPKGDQEVDTFIAPYTSKWAFWFKKIETLSKLGKYTLKLNAMISESNVTVFGGKPLPSYSLDFTIKEGNAESFELGTFGPTIPVGVPFDIPVHIKDSYCHPTNPPPNLKFTLSCSDLELNYDTVHISGTMFTIKGVRARGKVQNYPESTTYDLKVTLPGLKNDTKIAKIGLLPGNAHSLLVRPEQNPVKIENGNSVAFHFEIHDEAGNITARPKQIVRCQVHGIPAEFIDCSSTGTGHLTTQPINVDITEGEPEMLKLHFDMPNQKNIALVMRELKVLPSTRVSVMELCSQVDDKLVLRNNEIIEWPAGGQLENLFYKLYDEAGREVLLTAEIASMIKVNWTGDVNLEDLVKGKLPDIKVPTQVKDRRFYQVSYQDQSVSVSFTIVPHPDEPARLQVTLHQNTVRLGETLPGNIFLELVDQYDNSTKALKPTCVEQMAVDAEGLDKSAVTFKWQESSGSVVVTGVRFQGGSPGAREMCFSYCDYVERVIVKVSPGVPAKLELVSGPAQPFQVLNDDCISEPFLIQLLDQWGNPSSDQRVVVDLKSSPSTLKVKADVTSQPVNADGKASFTVKGVSGPKGYYQLVFKGSFNKKPIPGPSVNLIVIPDPNKPVGLSVEYDTSAKCLAGGTFPVFSVTVVSDEGSPITTFNPAHVSMRLWSGESSGKTCPQTATEFKCSKPMENEKNDCFRFRDKEIPEHVGKHTIQFFLRIDKENFLCSDQIFINVVANQPVKLGPDSQPPTPVVSYSKDITSRTLVEDMTLRIMDLYGNPAGQDLDGKVVVSIKCPNGQRNKTLPQLEGEANNFQINLEGGKAHITRLAVVENSPGENGSSYVLVFKPEVPMLPTPLAPFELSFRFYNDADCQQKMSELTKKKDEFTRTIMSHTETFSMQKELLQMLTALHQDLSMKEAYFRNELDRRNLKIPQPASSTSIDRILKEKKTEADQILKTSRRVCTLRDNFRGQQDVLGMVGHLAFVEDDAAAWVISWHIRGDMDCVITKTTAAARKIFEDTHGRQQVIPLDSVYVPPGQRPLPHIRNGRRLFDPPGNPVFARDLLIYPQDPMSCDIAFKNLLGDTIVIDDLTSAQNYRNAVVQTKAPCPTILTRQGHRVSGKGKFGGAQNRAPERSREPTFGAPLPQQYYALNEHIDLLTKYQSALKKKVDAEKDRETHIKHMNSPEMLKNQKEMEEAKKHLQEIDQQLASASGRARKRGPGNAGEPSGISTKRTRPC
ncbi:structural maintenance of chromosomes flexible hinge domain-containing protein 1 isoform X2 [Mugil cephalus]|uniref:structural maintenance of chromosomes flexible hinge domain-containing protein 1 isoform X2 n=1 Tax=Mugil cephalus TaxID=48193 RepID=UPI001FB6122B|nr:structural maintenance of chromosomes flexible hinge domain-containing protein 1 isoform X2 [Mugil cephalus]